MGDSEKEDVLRALGFENLSNTMIWCYKIVLYLIDIYIFTSNLVINATNNFLFEKQPVIKL